MNEYEVQLVTVEARPTAVSRGVARCSSPSSSVVGPGAKGGRHRARRTARARSSTALRPELSASEAADVLWLLSDPAAYRRFVIERGWKEGRYERWLGRTLVALLIADDYEPVPA